MKRLFKEHLWVLIVLSICAMEAREQLQKSGVAAALVTRHEGAFKWSCLFPLVSEINMNLDFSWKILISKVIDAILN